MPSYKVLYDPLPPHTKEKYVDFYPLKSVIFGDEEDSRHSSDIFKQEKIYGKALIGFAGSNPIWLYQSFPREFIIENYD